MSILLSIIYLCMLFMVFIYPGWVFLTETYKGIHPDEPIPNSIKIGGWIPYYSSLQYFVIMYNNKKLKLFSFIQLALVVVLRVLALVAVKNSLFLLITGVLDMLTIVYIWLVSAWAYFDMSKLVDCGVLTKIMCFVLPPVGAYLVAKKIAPFMKNQKDVVKETFINGV